MHNTKFDHRMLRIDIPPGRFGMNEKRESQEQPHTWQDHPRAYNQSRHNASPLCHRKAIMLRLSRYLVEPGEPSGFPFDGLPMTCVSRGFGRAPVLMRTWTSTASSLTSSGKGGNG